MKRLVLCAVALSMLAMPIAQAQAGPRYDGPRHDGPRHERQDQNWNQNWKKPGYKKHDDRFSRHDRKSVNRHHWARGKQVPAWQRKHVVRDYHRHGLRRPAYGQQWVRVDNDFLLISIASGLIAGIVASQY
jgi:Ni/Co efflux regulator RcnB